MKPSIIFRLEASEKFGTGHLIRCINLASFFDNTIPFCFILKANKGQSRVLSILKNLRILYYLLPETCKYLDEVNYIRENFIFNSPDIFITDLAHNQMITDQSILSNYHEILKSSYSGIKILSIEDCRIKKFTSDTVVIPQNCSVKAFNDKVKILSGLKYFIFPKKFIFFRKQEKEIVETGRKVLVCIGGTDPFNITVKVINALLKLPHDTLEAKVICGPAMDQHKVDEINNICSHNANLQQVAFGDDLVEQLFWADIAIVGEGLIKFDAAVFGIPSIMITQFDHDSDPVKNFIKLNCAVYAGKGGELKEEDLKLVIYDLLNNFQKRKELSKNGLNSIDPEGGKRIFENEIKPHL